MLTKKIGNWKSRGGSTNSYKILVRRVYNKRGRWKNVRKKSKCGQKLHEFKGIGGNFGKSQNCFSKNRSFPHPPFYIQLGSGE